MFSISFKYNFLFKLGSPLIFQDFWEIKVGWFFNLIKYNLYKRYRMVYIF